MPKLSSNKGFVPGNFWIWWFVLCWSHMSGLPSVCGLRYARQPYKQLVTARADCRSWCTRFCELQSQTICWRHRRSHRSNVCECSNFQQRKSPEVNLSNSAILDLLDSLSVDTFSHSQPFCILCNANMRLALIWQSCIIKVLTSAFWFF